MKNKKTSIVLISVLAVCVLGVVASLFIDWPVDADKSGGNIAKSTRFSRKTADEDSSLMQELLLNDEDFKNGMVVAYVVMKTRADHFNALVDMSEEVAGDIAEFQDVISDMKKAEKMADNVCATLDAAREDLSAALGGESSKDLAQNTTNGALAYSTMQKQNGLALRFVEIADNYIANNEADDRLKMVRDQWVDYQRMTAALNQDEEGVAAMDSKGYLLSQASSLNTLGMFDLGSQQAVISHAELNVMMGYDNSMCPVQTIALKQDALNSRNIDALNSRNIDALNSRNIDALNSRDADALNSRNIDALNARNIEALNSFYQESLASRRNIDALNSRNAEALNSRNIESLGLMADAKSLAEIIVIWTPMGMINSDALNYAMPHLQSFTNDAIQAIGTGNTETIKAVFEASR